MSYRRPTDLPTTQPPPHRKETGERERQRQGNGERPKITGRRPQRQGTAGKEPAVEKERPGATALGERARQQAPGGTPRWRGTPHRKDRHCPRPPTSPHRETPKRRDHTGAQGRPSLEAQARQDAPPLPRPDTARTTPGRAHGPPVPGEGGCTHTGGGGYSHTGNRLEHRTTGHSTLAARRRPQPQQGPPHKRNGTDAGGERGHGRKTKDGGRHGGRETD